MLRQSLLVILIACCFPGWSQVKNIGLPYVKNFTKEIYQQHPRNLAVVQGKNGIMYFGNGNGLMEFDGTHWNLLAMPNKSAVISLGVDEDDGTIYVGAQGEFGYLAPDSTGNIRYISLSSTLPKNTAGFGDIWKISSRNGTLTAIASNMIMFRDVDKNWTITQPKGHFFPGFEVHHKIFVFDSDRGLLEFQNNQFFPLRKAQLLKDKRIMAMLPLSDRTMLIGSEDGSLFSYDGTAVLPWKTSAEKFLRQHQLINAIILEDGSIVIGTLHNGFLVLDKQGNPLQHINASKGLQSSSILCMYSDPGGNLWLGLENGIDFVELSSPFTFINERSGLPGTGFASIQDGERLYLGTSHGVYYKDGFDSEDPLISDGGFKLLKNSSGQVWNLDNNFGELLIGHNNGAYRIKQEKAETITDGGNWIFRRSDKHPGILLAGGYSALSILEKKDDAWRFKNIVPDFRESFRVMEEDRQGNLWLSHPHKGVYRLTLQDSLNKFTSVKFYNASHGLPSPFSNYISKIDDDVVFLTERGVYKYVDSTDRFEPDLRFTKYFEGKAITKLVEDTRGNLWFVAEQRPGILLKGGDGYTRSDEPFGKLEGKLVANFEHINPIDETNVLFGTEEGFVHYDPSRYHDEKSPFYVHLRKVEDTNSEELLWGNSSYMKAPDGLRLPYERNALRFTFSCTSFRDLEKNRYQYMLIGFDKGWSEWTSRTQKEYTNLPEGKYIFKVRARNDNHELSVQDASFVFRIDPPWYRTSAAYMVYLLMGILTLAGMIKLVNAQKEKQLRQEKIKSQQKIIQLENEKLENEVNFKHRELASLALNITSKNEILDQIKTQVKLVSTTMDDQGKSALTQIIKLIDNNIRLDKDWEKFEFYFDQVHSNFLKQMRERYPDLTISQLKLCAYLKMNLSSKEIAILMNVSVAAVEKSRYRLRKKFNLEHELMLADFIQKL